MLAELQKRLSPEAVYEVSVVHAGEPLLEMTGTRFEVKRNRYCGGRHDALWDGGWSLTQILQQDIAAE
jgi:hypothetical protein